MIKKGASGQLDPSAKYINIQSTNNETSYRKKRQNFEKPRIRKLSSSGDKVRKDKSKLKKSRLQHNTKPRTKQAVNQKSTQKLRVLKAPANFT